jgi:hypothetical protein
VLTLEEKQPCGYCCHEFGPNALALRWHGVEFCTHDCLESYAEGIPGRDFIAAQDQALAEVLRVAKERPDTFVMLYHDTSEHAIASVVLASPEFIAACLPALAQLALEDGNVAPPD